MGEVAAEGSRASRPRARRPSRRARRQTVETRPVGADVEAARQQLQRLMRDAEADIAEALSNDGWLTVLDGPLHGIRHRRGLPVIGYVKTHHRRMLAREHWVRVPELTAARSERAIRARQPHRQRRGRTPRRGQPWSPPPRIPAARGPLSPAARIRDVRPPEGVHLACVVRSCWRTGRPPPYTPSGPPCRALYSGRLTVGSPPAAFNAPPVRASRIYDRDRLEGPTATTHLLTPTPQSPYPDC